MQWAKTSFKGHYVASDRAFLFSLVNPQGFPPTQYEITKKPYAICYHPEYVIFLLKNNFTYIYTPLQNELFCYFLNARCGPIFGAGADLLIASNCNTNMDSYSNLPHSYDGENASNSTLMGEYNFSVIDYEVFTLTTK